MSDWQQGDVYNGGVRVHFYRTGQGDKPPLLLAHGFSDNGLCWTPTAQVLMDDFDVVMVDARNHGQSDAGAADIKSLADDLAAVVTQLELGAVSALGHSVGASVVTALAADYPHLVNRLLLEDPPWRQPQREDSNPRKKRKSNKGGARPRDAAFRKLVAQMAQFSEAKMLQHGHTQHPTWQDADYAPWGLSNRQVAADAMALLDMSGWQQYLQRVACPSLLIYADAQRDGIVTPATAAWVQQINPNVEATQVSDAGHNIRRENFVGFMSVVKGFLSAP